MHPFRTINYTLKSCHLYHCSREYGSWPLTQMKVFFARIAAASKAALFLTRWPSARGTHRPNWFIAMVRNRCGHLFQKSGLGSLKKPLSAPIPPPKKVALMSSKPSKPTPSLPGIIPIRCPWISHSLVWLATNPWAACVKRFCSFCARHVSRLVLSVLYVVVEEMCVKRGDTGTLWSAC